MTSVAELETPPGQRLFPTFIVKVIAKAHSQDIALFLNFYEYLHKSTLKKTHLKKKLF